MSSQQIPSVNDQKDDMMQLDDEQSETLQQHSSEVRIDVLPGSKGGRVGGRPHASSFTEGEDEALQNL